METQVWDWIVEIGPGVVAARGCLGLGEPETKTQAYVLRESMDRDPGPILGYLAGGENGDQARDLGT